MIRQKPNWKLQELRELIERVHGGVQLSKAAGYINSVDWKIQSASYHSYAAINAFASVFEDVEHEPISVVAKMMLTSGEEATRFHKASFIYEANVIACAQAMHSVADIISHVILNALAINDVNDENLSFKSIKKHVPNSGLKDKIVRVSGLKSFRYLQDFVNTTKHIRLVNSAYTVDLTGEEERPHGLRFKAFQFKKRSHKAKWGPDFLKELNELSIEYVNLGQEINVFLARQAR